VATPAAGNTDTTLLAAAGAGEAKAAAAPAAAATALVAEATKPVEAVADKSMLESANDEAKPEGEKKPDEKPAESNVVEPEYTKELKHPEGVEWNENAWKAVAPVLAQHKVSKEAAQALIDQYSAFQSAQNAELIREVTEQRKLARAECMKIFKKEDFQSARRALDREIPDEHLRNVLMQQLGDHPSFIGMLAKFGRAIADDSTPGATGSSGGQGEASRAKKFYPQG
jgi:hypothetical protein